MIVERVFGFAYPPYWIERPLILLCGMTVASPCLWIEQYEQTQDLRLHFWLMAGIFFSVFGMVVRVLSNSDNHAILSADLLFTAIEHSNQVLAEGETRELIWKMVPSTRRERKLGAGENVIHLRVPSAPNPLRMTRFVDIRCGLSAETFRAWVDLLRNPYTPPGQEKNLE